MTAFVDGVNLLFSDDDVAVDATYTPDGGAGAAVRVIVMEDSEFVAAGQSDVTDRRTVIAIRSSDVAAPGRDDTVLVGSTTYTVESVIDDDGLEMRLAVYE